MAGYETISSVQKVRSQRKLKITNSQYILSITCLTVHPENTLETLSDTVQFRPVVELDELVVLHPGRQLGKAEVVPVFH